MYFSQNIWIHESEIQIDLQVTKLYISFKSAFVVMSSDMTIIDLFLGCLHQVQTINLSIAADAEQMDYWRKWLRHSQDSIPHNTSVQIHQTN